jgi:hypothetical protein
MSSDEESLSSSYNSEDNQDHDQEQDQGADEDQDVENKNDGAEEEEATPNTITFDSPIVSVEFHNSADKIACGLMDGVVAL